MSHRIKEDIVMPELDTFKKEQSRKKHVLLFNKIKSVPKKYLIPALSLGVLAVVGLSFVLFAGNAPAEVVVLAQEPIAEVKEVVEVEELFESPLTGVLVPKVASERPVTGVMIENSLKARPQSGLLEAGVIFEAIAEGGVTRFLALYQEGAPNYFGPIRSARPYYVQWLAPFDAAYVHVGGDIAGRGAVSEYIGGKDLDQFKYGGSYNRISSRPAPHNVYTSFEEIDKLNSAPSEFDAWARKDDAPIEVPVAEDIKLSISSNSFNPSYVYDAPSNSYKRSMGSTPHTDQQSGAQITAKVVVAMQMSSSSYLAEDGGRTRYQNIGSGKAWFFQDGNAVVGRWKKDSPSAQLVFTDGAGVEMSFNRGQTWISAVKGASW